jgi:alpha-L-fucosidase
MDLGSHRDLVGELAEAIRTNTSVKFGLYYSLFEWFNPLYLSDKRSGFADQDFVRSKTIPELYDLVNQYKPEIIWSDGEWEANSTYWNSTEFIAWLYNSSPVKDTVVVNDRWGLETSCHHGDFYTCTDNYDSGKLRTHKWEDSLPLDQRSFGYRRDLHLTDVLTIESVISHLVKAVSCGGNILINIGPTKEGTIAPIFEERLLQLGKWLSPNGEAIYGTRPWKFQNDTTNSNVWYTANPISNDVYAILLKYPIGDKTVSISSPTITESTTVSLLGYSGALQWVGPDQGGILIDLSSINDAQVITNWAWVFKLRNVA